MFFRLHFADSFAVVNNECDGEVAAAVAASRAEHTGQTARLLDMAQSRAGVKMGKTATPGPRQCYSRAAPRRCDDRMPFRLAATVVLLVHLGFILFVVFGAAALARHAWLAILHLPAAIWGVAIELTGRTCPLTWLENWLRARAGLAGYADDFVNHYLLRMIYPTGLTRCAELLLGGALLAVNVALYAWAWRRRGGTWTKPPRRRN
jgi:hypothetical protein